MIFGVIPAAGKSVRMGQPKLALRRGDRSVVEFVIGALRLGGVDEAVVVLGPHVAELEPIARKAGAQVLLLPQETTDMRATVEAGLGWLETHFGPLSSDFWLLAPADHPTMDPQVVRQLIEAKKGLADDAIVVPTWQGRRGHPTLVGWPHVAAIRQFPKELGLNVYLRQCQGTMSEIDVSSRAILDDMDTPEDFTRLMQ
jgi:molybdenum cofactor cytidylyltransferase